MTREGKAKAPGTESNRTESNQEEVERKRESSRWENGVELETVLKNGSKKKKEKTARWENRRK